MIFTRSESKQASLWAQMSLYHSIYMSKQFE